MSDKVLALIPAFNEELRIKTTINSLSAIKEISRIVVVDDGSSDSTSIKAREAGAEVIELTQNMGKGDAVNKALTLLRDYETLLLLDADLGESGREAVKLIEPVNSGAADMAIADFPKPEIKGGFGLVKGLAAWGIKRCCGLSVQEPLSGQRAMRKSVIEAIGQLDSGFGVDVGLTIDARRLGFKIIEVPTTMSHAATGRNMVGFMHRGKQFYYVFKALIRRLR